MTTEISPELRIERAKKAFIKAHKDFLIFNREIKKSLFELAIRDG